MLSALRCFEVNRTVIALFHSKWALTIGGYASDHALVLAHCKVTATSA